MYYNPMGGAFYLNDIERALIWQDCRIPGALPDTFQESACMILGKMRLGPDYLAQRLPLSAEECEQIFLKKGDQQISLAHVLVFCITIIVPEDIAVMLIEKAGYTLQDDLELHQCYRKLLQITEQINGSLTAANNTLYNWRLSPLI